MRLPLQKLVVVRCTITPFNRDFLPFAVNRFGKCDFGGIMLRVYASLGARSPASLDWLSGFALRSSAADLSLGSSSSFRVLCDLSGNFSPAPRHLPLATKSRLFRFYALFAR